MSKHQNRPNEARQLGKADLKGFDKQAIELILWAQEQGARVRISRRGHAILLAPNGGTAAISRKSTSSNRASKNNRAGVERMFKEEGE